MRWKGFITLFAGLALFIAGAVVFAPRIIHRTIEKTGTAVWGAKVEVENVELSFSTLGITIKGFTVASRTEEFENLLQTESLNFSMIVAPLLERKLNIEEISGTGLAFGTERETSGFIPRPVKEEKEDRVSAYRRQLSRWLSQIKDRTAESIQVPDVDPGELDSYNKARQATEELDGLKEKSKTLKDTNARLIISRLERAAGELEGMSIKTEKDILPARDKIQNLREAVEHAENFVEGLNSSLAEFQRRAESLSATVGEIDRARRLDYERIMDELQLPSIEAGDIAETVFGPLIVNRFRTFSGYMQTLRKYIPPGTEKKKVSRPPRFKGEDVVFYREKMHPPFLVRKALLSGAGGAYIQAEDFSTAPWILGRTSVLSAGGENFKIRASFDRSRDTARDRLDMEYRNFKIDRATGDLNLEAEFEGGEIDSKIYWAGYGLLPSDWLEYIRLENPKIEIQATVSGNRNNPSFNISSNLDGILSRRLKEELQMHIQQARSRVESIVDEQVLARGEELINEASQLRKETENTIKEQRQLVLQKKREAEEEIEKKGEEIEKVLADAASDVEDRLRDFFR